jgi:hypothetical protein
LGLRVEVIYIGDQAQQLQGILDYHFEEIRSTPVGKELLDKLEGDPFDYQIQIDTTTCTREEGLLTDIQGGVTVINPFIESYIYTDFGIQRASLTRILAHELGHLAGQREAKDKSDNLKMENVNRYENPIMYELELYNRTRYDHPEKPVNY